MDPPAEPGSFLSVEQLRWKRLVAFGIENATPLLANAATGTTTSATAKPTVETQQQSPPKSDAIIDMLDAEDQDLEEVQVVPPTENRKREYQTPIILIDDDEDDENGDAREQPTENYHQRPSKKQSQEDDNVRKPTSSTAVGTSSQTGSTERRDQCSFQVATWNVWFGPWGDGNPHATLRMKAIVQILMQQQQQHPSMPSKPPLYCIGFQEVVAETMRPLKSLLEQQHRYHWFEQPRAAYKCTMALHPDLVILEHGWIPYADTSMDRGFLYARAQLPPTTNHKQQQQPKEIIFTTTHLESFTGKDYNGGAQRLVQVQELASFLQKQMSQHPSICLSILSGDLNWDDERRRMTSSTAATIDPILLSSIPPVWKDTWLEVNQPPPPPNTTKKAKTTKTAVVEGYTYDSKLNPMLSGSLRRRFDRVLVRSSSSSNPTTTTTALQIRDAQLLGTTAIAADLTWEKLNTYTQTTRSVPTAPSDHFGYIVTLQIDDDE